MGQGLLMARYTHAFGAHGVTVSQVLLTADDLMRRSHHMNAFRALNRLLNLGVVPVVNENDTVATHKIRFGDNDRLSALVRTWSGLMHCCCSPTSTPSMTDRPPMAPSGFRRWTAPRTLRA